MLFDREVKHSFLNAANPALDAGFRSQADRGQAAPRVVEA